MPGGGTRGGGEPSPAMAPWLSRAEREARGQAERETTSLRSTGGSGGVSQATSSSSTPRSERRRSRLSCGISSGSSSRRRRPSDQILDERGESCGASTPAAVPSDHDSDVSQLPDRLDFAISPLDFAVKELGPLLQDGDLKSCGCPRGCWQAIAEDEEALSLW